MVQDKLPRFPSSQPPAVAREGKRIPKLGRKGIGLHKRQPGESSLLAEQRREVLHGTLEPVIQRESHYRGLAFEDGGNSVELIGWAEVAGESDGNEVSL